MKLQQLRYAVEILRHNLNISEAAESLFTSQPGVSKQILLLEEELGTPIFVRNGKRIVGITPPGKIILDTAQRILREVHNIKNISGEFRQMPSGTLTIAATHAQIAYRLPEVVAYFAHAYPDVCLNIKQSAPDDIVRMVLNGEADLGIGANLGEATDIRRLPCGQWVYALVVPRQHALAAQSSISLHDIAAYPLLCDGTILQAASTVHRTFRHAGIQHINIALQAADHRLLCDYARLGLGVALMDKRAADKVGDEMAVLDVGHLFAPSFDQIAMRKDSLIRDYTYDFIEYFCKDLNQARVNKLLYAPDIEDFSI